MKCRLVPLLAYAFIVLAPLAFPHRVVAEDSVAILTGLKGAVESSRSGEGGWRKAEIGLTLRAGDKLRTGDAAAATLLLANGRKLSVLPNSIVDFFPEMGRDKGDQSGVGKAAKGLWNALVGKFSESRDISVAKGVVGTTRAPRRLVGDGTLSEDEQRQLGEQVSDLETMEIDEVSRHLLLAVLFEGAKQYARAEANYIAAIELSPAEGRLYDTLGSLYTRLGQKEKLNDLKEQKKKMVLADDSEGSPRSP
jgi:hypothetical protein